jgi:glycosyltransferase involved in cell wall biosynthesis
VDLCGVLEASQMESFYRSVAALVVPSRTTSNWSEQFGRVLVEAQAVGTRSSRTTVGRSPGSPR